MPIRLDPFTPGWTYAGTSKIAPEVIVEKVVPDTVGAGNGTRLVEAVRVPVVVSKDRGTSPHPDVARRRRSIARLLAVVTHAGGILPSVVLGWDAVTDRLTANPIQAITARTGSTALILLVLCLTVTPVARILGQRWALPLRRPLGLYAFYYATLHFATFVVLDYGLDLQLIWNTVLEKRYVLAGLASFGVMTPLVLTSTGGMQRRLGRSWVRLHRLTYIAAIGAVVHFVWLVKADLREPLAYGAGVAALLLLRVPAIRRRLAQWVGVTPSRRGENHDAAYTRQQGSGTARAAP